MEQYVVILGGFTAATIRVTAMTRNACMQSSVSQMALRKLSIYTGINSSQIVASADTDSCLLKSDDFGRYFFFSSVKEIIHYKVHKIVCGRVMKNGA